MRSSSRARAAGVAAAACLLAAGCDYWKNLVDGKEVDRASVLAVRVRDVWTGEPVRAVCKDAGSGFESEAGSDGLIVKQGAVTGSYALLCDDLEGNYHRGERKFELVPSEAETVTVAMARLGGPRWYDEADRRVRIEFIRAPAQRVPETVDLGAWPRDSAGLFRYEWYQEDALVGKGGESTRAHGLVKADSGLRIFSVRVWAMMPGYAAYLVGTDSTRAVFTANRAPVISLTLSDSLKMYSPGCPDPLTFAYVADDFDGTCDSVRFSSIGPAPSLGQGFDTVVSCFPVPRPISLPLPVPNQGATPREERLLATVWDENLDTAQAVLRFRTIGNQAPTIRPFPGQRINPAEFVEFPVRRSFIADDLDSRMIKVSIEWGDGPVLEHTLSGTVNTDTIHLSHVYHTDSSFKAYATVHDDCGNPSRRFHLGDINVNVNKKPVLAALGHDYPKADELRLRINAGDYDMRELKADSLTIYVDWDHAGAGPDSTKVPCCLDAQGLELVHDYDEPIGARKVTVRVRDAHQADTLHRWDISP